MRKLITAILIAFTGMEVMAQAPTPIPGAIPMPGAVPTQGPFMQGKMEAIKLDTNVLAYDEQGKELRYYQYEKLVGSGEYTLRGRGGLPGAPGTKLMVVKMPPEQMEEMYKMVKPMITIKAGALREGNVMDVKPLLKMLKNETLDRKAVLLIFWGVNCPPCTSVFGNFNDLFKEVNDPELVTIGISNDYKSDANEQLKKTPLNATYLLNDASRISGAYGMDGYPVYVLADKDHNVTFALRGGSPFVMPALRKAIKEALVK